MKDICASGVQRVGRKQSAEGFQDGGYIEGRNRE